RFRRSPGRHHHRCQSRRPSRGRVRPQLPCAKTMTGDAPTILIVEDEPPIRRLLRTTLAAHDYRPIEAATGAEALSALRHHRPDLVLLDLGLPDIDGQALIARIRELSPVPIVILSSRG